MKDAFEKRGWQLTKKQSVLAILAILTSPVLFVSYGGCDQFRSHHQEKATAHPRDPLDAIIGTDNQKVLYSELLDEKTLQETLGLYDMVTGAKKELRRGRVSYLARTPIPHLFSVNIAEVGEHEDRLTFIDDAGVNRGEMKHPNAGSFIIPQWARDGRCFFFAMDRPGTSDDSPDYDPLGFNAFAVVGYPSLELKWYPLKRPGKYVTFAAFDRLLYVSQGLSENVNDSAVDIYDIAGNRLSTRSGMHGTNFSVTGKYYLPHLHEGELPFEIYDTRTGKPLLFFRNDEPKQGDRYNYGDWNPQIDNLLLITHTTSDNNNAERTVVEVYDISLGRPIITTAEKTYGWTADGKGLLVFRNSRFEILKVNFPK